MPGRTMSNIRAITSQSLLGDETFPVILTKFLDRTRQNRHLKLQKSGHFKNIFTKIEAF